jgi:hypothetical protein
MRSILQDFHWQASIRGHTYRFETILRKVLMKLSQKPSDIKSPYLPFENPIDPDNKKTNFEFQIIPTYFD